MTDVDDHGGSLDAKEHRYPLRTFRPIRHCAAVRTDSDAVWNRSAMERGGQHPQTGDAALAALLSVHSLAMSGGLLHSAESHSADSLAEAVEGYRYFGLHEAATALEWAIDQVREVDLDADLDEAERIELEADRRYGEAVPDDDALYDAFVGLLVASPDAFAPT